MKEGEYSTEFYNHLIFEQQQKQGVDIEYCGDQAIYHAMPIMMQKNHHAHGIYNGDMGLIWQHDSQFWIYFLTSDAQLKRFLPGQIQGWSSAHAITVHKSQGSEYEQVAFACAAKDSPLLNKEMFYTAITRAKQHFYCLADMDELIVAINNPSSRVSALSQRLLMG